MTFSKKVFAFFYVRGKIPLTMSYIKRSKKNGKVYLSEVETKRINGKIVTKHIRYLGKEADGKTILSSSISNVEIEEVKVYGPLLALHHIASELKLPAILGEYSNEILSMTYAHCINYESINHMPSWFKRTDLNMLLNLDGLTESRLLRALDSLESFNPTILQKNIFKSVEGKHKINKKGILYDVTNTYFHGTKCPLGKMGKDKKGVKGRKLIQIGLGVTQDYGIPVFHKVFHGNIHDSRTLQDMITTFSEYKIENGLFIFDRGITSKKNHVDIKNLKWKVLCGIPRDSKIKQLIREVKNKREILEYKNRVKLNKTIFYVETISHEVAGVKGKLAICFNEQKKKDLKESRYDEIAEAKSLLNEKKEIKEGLEKFFNNKGKLLLEKVKEVEEFDGYTTIFTTAKLSKEKMVQKYFDKDLVEKAFQSLNGVIHLRPIRHWLYNRVIAHVFICYLSYLLLSIFQMKLRPLEITSTKALKELDTLYKIYMKDNKKDFKIHRTVALNKIQEKILKALDKKLLNQV